ncbi:MAG: acyl carrier protein [Limnobacter sp.]|uniref:acyl carrier protein n=1 Tax=Limnobacter sp. TaxID=2003368 RepID=UPI0022BA886B|nr:acyl carrier protein [Limnobacter sp.]MCZ8014918.1 acyl carrier protein [Limnobacter sp.]
MSRSQNFFDAGGNSLSIVVLHEKIEKLFCLHLPLMQLFQTTTIETQAHAIEALLNTDPDKQTLAGQGPPTSKPGGRQRFIAARTRHRTGDTT